MIVTLLISAAAPLTVQADGVMQSAATPWGVTHCKSKDREEVVVCGRSKDPYRIDPSVLSSIRAREAVPPKPDANAEAASASPRCIGPQECGGAVVPLVAVALKTLEAATLAAKGEDWREAFRTHEDEYRLYQQSQERRARARRPKIGFGVSK